MKKDDVIETFNLLQTGENAKKNFDADISARIPYRLHCCVYNFDREVWVEDDILYNYDLGGNCLTLKILNEHSACLMYYQIRPYLRPMSSMTEEERKIYIEISSHLCGEIAAKTMIDWLNAHHFDYRGLIEKGLAIAVTEENNPYKE